MLPNDNCKSDCMFSIIALNSKISLCLIQKSNDIYIPIMPY